MNRILLGTSILVLFLAAPALCDGPRDGTVAMNAGGSWLALAPSGLVYGYRDTVRPVTMTVAGLRAVSLSGAGWWVAVSPEAVLIGYREVVRRVKSLPEGFGEPRALIDEQGWWVVAGAAGAMVGCKDDIKSRMFRFEGAPAGGPVHAAMNDAAEWVALAPAGMVHGRRDQLVLSLPFSGPVAPTGAEMNLDGRWVFATDRGVIAGRKDQVQVQEGRLVPARWAAR